LHSDADVDALVNGLTQEWQGQRLSEAA